MQTMLGLDLMGLLLSSSPSIDNSGNTHRVVQIHGTREDVEAEIRKVFNRAGIRDHNMVGTRGDAIDYCRAYHNHRGSNEGKKVDSCLITASY